MEAGSYHGRYRHGWIQVYSKVSTKTHVCQHAMTIANGANEMGRVTSVTEVLSPAVS
jgi:hypothetical protein